MAATTETVRAPWRYLGVAAFSMPGGSREAIADALRAPGLAVHLCRRGGLVIRRGSARWRLTAETTAPLLTLQAAIELIGKAPVPGVVASGCEADS